MQTHISTLVRSDPVPVASRRPLLTHRWTLKQAVQILYFVKMKMKGPHSRGTTLPIPLVSPFSMQTVLFIKGKQKAGEFFPFIVDPRANSFLQERSLVGRVRCPGKPQYQVKQNLFLFVKIAKNMQVQSTLVISTSVISKIAYLEEKNLVLV